MTRALPHPLAAGASQIWRDCHFYVAHRFLHIRAVYKYVHKTHHEFKQNVAPAAEHFHPAEDVMNGDAYHSILSAVPSSTHLSNLLEQCG